MSRFKRYQSKVFWGQMESRDLGGVFVPVQPREVEEIVSADDSDANEAENITVIRVEMEEERQDRSGDQVIAAGNDEDRALSRASRGQRSQDSGFSDSGRSDDSSGPDSPVRNRQRRSSRRRAHRPRLENLRINDAQPQQEENKPHTSTPKQDGRLMQREQELDLLRLRLDEAEHEERVASAASNHSGFTLFSTSEPPIDEQFSSIAPTSSAESSRHHPLQGLDVRAPVRAWFEELRNDVENECMSMLQSKSLPQKRCRGSAMTAAMKLVDAADSFDRLYRHALDSMSHSKNGKIDRNLLHSIESEAADILTRLGSTAPRRIAPQENLRNISVQLARLKNAVERAVDGRLDFYIGKIVREIENGPLQSGSSDRGARAALLALGLTGARASASIARCSGIRALLLGLLSTQTSSADLRSTSLHALAAVCCCLDAMDQFVREGGPEILADVLANESTPRVVKFHAAALLVQITAPWIDRVGLPYVERFGSQLIPALTALPENSDCKDTLLLAAAAINNLSHSRRCVPEIIGCDSIRRLLRCLEQSGDDNVNLLEQIAALIGQVGRVPQSRVYLFETRAALVLVRYLRMPTDPDDKIQRLKATSSESLARLCEYPEIAKQVIDSETNNEPIYATIDEIEASPLTSTPKQKSNKSANRSLRQEQEELDRQLQSCFNEMDYEHERAASTTSQQSLDTLFSASEPPEDETTYLPLPSYIEQQHRPGPGLDVRAPVKIWIKELRSGVEDECMSMLQSKALPRKKCRTSAFTAAMKIIDAADRFEIRYRQVLGSISRSTSGRLETALLHSLEAEAIESLLNLGSSPPRRLALQENPRSISIQLGQLKHTVDKALDNRLDFHVEKIVRDLEDSPDEGANSSRGSRAALLALGLTGARASASIARCSGIRALLISLVSSTRLPNDLRSTSLHALAAVCCCPDAMEQFVREGGPEILADMLANEATPHAVKFHAAALLVQITAPWVERVGLPYVEKFGPQLVKALTELPESSGCKDTLLLAAAALNNLARSKWCVLEIIKCGSIKRLLRCVKKSSMRNVCLVEQVASLIGQVARVPQARAHLAEAHASVALMCFLRMQPPGLEDNYRRLEATASEALARLCAYPEIARQVVTVGGSDCLPNSTVREVGVRILARDEIQI